MKKILLASIVALVSGNVVAADTLPEWNASTETEFLQLAGNKWTEISSDVFEYRASDGTLYRRGFGDNAAHYDLDRLTAELTQTNASLSQFQGDAQALAALQTYQRNLVTAAGALQARFVRVSSTPIGAQLHNGQSATNVSYANGSGSLTCSFSVHQLADFYRPGSLGGSEAGAVSTVTYVPTGVAGSTLSATFYVSATADSYSTNNTASATAGYNTSSPAGTLSTKASGLVSFSGSSLSTYSYESVASQAGACPGGYFTSFTQSATL